MIWWPTAGNIPTSGVGLDVFENEPALAPGLN